MYSAKQLEKICKDLEQEFFERNNDDSTPNEWYDEFNKKLYYYSMLMNKDFDVWVDENYEWHLKPKPVTWQTFI